MIILEKINSVGPWGFSNNSEALLSRQIYSQKSEDSPWEIQANSIEEQIISGKLDGRIPRELLIEEESCKNRFQSGPHETRFADKLLSIFMGSSKAISNIDFDQVNLVCAVEPQGSLVGYRNGLRLGFRVGLGYEEEYFIEKLNQIFSDTHPMISLHNMPNQMLGNLAISFGIGGETVNCAGRNSSFEAIQVGKRMITADKNQKIILVGAFCYRVSMILNLRIPISLGSIKSLQKDQVSLNEYVGFTTMRFAKTPPKGSIGIRALGKKRIKAGESIKIGLSKLLSEILEKTDLAFEAIGAILVNDISTGLFVNKVLSLKSYNPALKVVDMYQRIGNSFHCSFLQSLEMAQLIFETGKIPGSLRKGYRDSMFFDGIEIQETPFQEKFILVAEFIFPDVIQLALVQGYTSR